MDEGGKAGSNDGMAIKRASEQGGDMLLDDQEHRHPGDEEGFPTGVGHVVQIWFSENLFEFKR